MKLLQARFDQSRYLCVGLDSDLKRIPNQKPGDSVESTLFNFNVAIIQATHRFAAAYKPNIAFYEPHGDAGVRVLYRTIALINDIAPEVPVILDAKRGDIGDTNKGYAEAAFELYKADAITVSPYFGGKALEPFFQYTDKGIIVLCRTSNPGAGEFQDRIVDGKPLYQLVAESVANSWNTNGNCCLVVGATYPKELVEVRRIVGDMVLLLPGIGKQGSDLEAAVKAGMNSRKQGILVNVSSGIIFASSEANFAQIAGEKAADYHTLINEHRMS